MSNSKNVEEESDIVCTCFWSRCLNFFLGRLKQIDSSASMPIAAITHRKTLQQVYQLETIPLLSELAEWQYVFERLSKLIEVS